MKNLIVLVSLVITTHAFASVPLRPVGTFEYTGQVKLNKKRTAETVSHITAQDRIQALKKLGFLCVRKNQQVSVCQKTETVFDGVPDYLQRAADVYLAKAKFVFPGDGEAYVVHDGSDTEWMIYEEAFIGGKKISAYKIVRKKDGNWYVSLPVSSEQGIGVLELYSESELALPLTVERKEEGQTVGYFFTAGFLAK